MSEIEKQTEMISLFIANARNCVGVEDCLSFRHCYCRELTKQFVKEILPQLQLTKPKPETITEKINENGTKSWTCW